MNLENVNLLSTVLNAAVKIIFPLHTNSNRKEIPTTRAPQSSVFSFAVYMANLFTVSFCVPPLALRGSLNDDSVSC